MPFFWISDKGNLVAIKFTKPSAEKVEETFASPDTSNVDADLLNYFKESAVGDAIEVSLKDSGLKTERSLKVRIGKHAKLANREIESKTASDGSFLFRVSAIIVPNGTATVTAPTTTTEETKEEGSNQNVENLTQEPVVGETSGRRR